MLHLVTFGGLALESVNEAVAPRLSAQRLAILAVLAAEGDRRVSRERLTGLFWPDADEERARHSLRQALYTLRHEIGREVVRSDFVLTLDSSAIASDVAAFRAALARGDRAAAGKLVRGPFLEGFYLPSASAFQRWAEEERARLHTAATGAIASLATEASAENNLDDAIGWWRQLASLDPLSGRFALGYLRALAARGDRAEALAFARAHTAVVKRELETEPDAEIRKLEASLRSVSAPSTSRGVSASTERTGSGVAAQQNPSPHVVAAPVAISAGRLGDLQRLTRIALTIGAVAAVVVSARFVGWRPTEHARASETIPMLAVGVIRDEGPDSARVGGVLTDMLSTNLARVTGLQVVANSRLLGLIPAGQDTSSAAYLDAARRAGATELLEGRLIDHSRETFTIEVRRIDLQTGVLKGVYRASAPTRFRLVDSVTAIVARELQLTEPPGPLADVTTRSATAYRLYQEGLRAYYGSDYTTARPLMRAALQDDSTFAMAAYYDAILSDAGFNREIVERALRLAKRAPDRERLVITADLLSRTLSPRAIAVAETLATWYQNDPRAHETLARVRNFTGDWAGAARAFERAIALDSAALDARDPCHVCEDFLALADVYYWWDSLPAAARVGRRFERLFPESSRPWEIMIWSTARAGDTAGAAEAFRQYTKLHTASRSAAYEVKINLLLEQYDNVQRDLRLLLESPKTGDYHEGRWWLLVALRNQGRLREARAFNETGRLPGLGPPQVPPADDYNKGLLALESGDARAAATAFLRLRRGFDTRPWAPGVAARNLAWSGTLAGVALAATGDTAAVLRMADTVEYWGQRSIFGRDQKAHHYLRGMVFVKAGRDDDAIREFRAAIHSYTLGFTRVNYELGRALLRRSRAREAVAVLQPALRGEVDAANLYVTRTDLHELLAQAFDKLGEADSAAVHYRAVVKAWANADPMFHARRDAARAWLGRYDPQRNKTDD